MVYKGVFIVTFLCISLLTACKFKPVYTNNTGSINTYLSAIEVEPIDTVAGAEFYYTLTNLLPKTHMVKAKYLLKVSFSNTTTMEILSKSSDVSRELLSQIVYYKLIDIGSGKVLTSGKFRHMTSYGITSTAYTSYIEHERTEEDLTREAATELLERIILYFTSHDNS